ncbi:MAG: hypothetical protein AAGA46_03240 [Cyanobacteria bacterium P01_F01_bin.13]
MTFAFSDAFRTAAAETGAVDLLDGGTLKLYTSGLGTMLYEYTLPSPAFVVGGTAGQAELQGGSISDNALAGGALADYTFEDSSSNVHVTGTGEISLAGGGGSLEVSLASLTVTSGQTLDVTGFNITFPATA